MNNLIKEAWDILKNNSNLYNAPILIWFLSDLLRVSYSPSIAFIVSITALGCINIAITSGWYNQIKVVLKTKEKSTFDDLLTGIGKYFNNILSGNIALLILFFISSIVVYTIAENFININDSQLKDIQKVYNEISKMKPEQITNYIKNIHPEIMSITYKWTLVILSYMGVAALFYFFISLWTQISVFTGEIWFQGWKKSISLIKKNIWTFTGLTLIQAWFYILFILVNLLTNDPFIQLLLIIISIVTEAYFAVLFCLFVFRFSDNIKIEVLKDDIQSSISEIQGKDNKK
ncbi:MAG: hypothetical protein U0354_04010 [Candidatus Sericytochromatia bacterium]